MGLVFVLRKCKKKIKCKRTGFISCFALRYTLVRINRLKVYPFESLQKGVRSREWSRDQDLPNPIQVEPERWSCFYAIDPQLISAPKFWGCMCFVIVQDCFILKSRLSSKLKTYLFNVQSSSESCMSMLIQRQIKVIN